jgi:hypothetical protein
MSESVNITVCVNIPRGLKRAALDVVARDGGSLSSIMRDALIDRVRKVGQWPPEKVQGPLVGDWASEVMSGFLAWSRAANSGFESKQDLSDHPTITAPDCMGWPKGVIWRGEIYIRPDALNSYLSDGGHDGEVVIREWGRRGWLKVEEGRTRTRIPYGKQGGPTRRAQMVCILPDRVNGR